MTAALRDLPQVDAVLRDVPELSAVGPGIARWLARRELEDARAQVLAGGQAGDVRAAVAVAASRLLGTGLGRVINATGVVLHTNLGRAPLSADARSAVDAAAGATALEMDLDGGERGARAPVAATLAAALCDAQDALVVNNNAGALLLALAALARGREVIVSRGELIEIGGAFRLPDVMEASGASLREVGTTNRTHARDYRRALCERTALILLVHPSNYQVVGFTKRPSLAEVVEVARGVPVLYDTGSGLLAPDDAFPEEPDAATVIAAGVDLVCFSGDKLLGGPQAGIIAGAREYVERCRAHPIARAVRADKLSLAALEATLWAHARGESVPARAMLALTTEEIGARARTIAAANPRLRVLDGHSVPGSGSAPGRSLPTVLLAVADPHPERLAAALRRHDPPVIARVERGSLLVDLRTVDAPDDHTVAAALASLP